MRKIIFASFIMILMLSVPHVSAAASNHNVVKMPDAMQISNPAGVFVADDGTIYYSSAQTNKIYSFNEDKRDIFAGLNVRDDNGQPMAGLHDDNKEDALFQAPAGIDMDETRNMYIADAGNHAIRLIDADGKVSTLAGDGVTGNRDGKGDHARFNGAMDIAVAKNGTVYVADTLNHVIRKITSDGEVTTLTKPSDRLVEFSKNDVTVGGDYQDGNIKNAMFNEPSSIVLDEAENLFIADSGNHVIRYMNFDNDEVSTVAGSADAKSYDEDALYLEGGYENGTLKEAAFNTPNGLAITKGGNLLVADTGNSQVRYINLSGDTVTSLTENGDVRYPASVAITATGDIIITSTRHSTLDKMILWDAPTGFGDYASILQQYEDEADISAYAMDAVYEMQRMDIMVGSNEGQYLFSPSNKLTRAQFAKIIVNALELKTSNQQNNFPDVADDEWYADYISTAVANGIVKGYENGKFGPNDPITRQQIAMMVGQAKQLKTNELSKKFYKDQHIISPEALPYVIALKEQGIMQGDADKFRPYDHVTREMGAVIIANML